MLLAAVIVLSAALPLLFVDYAEPDRVRTLTKLLAKTGSLAGTVLLMWQFILGFRPFSARLVPDLLWSYRLHRLVGIFGIFLIALHPVFITVYYARIGEENPWRLDPGRSFSWMVLLGIIAFVIMAVVVLSSSAMRDRLRKKQWYSLHLSTYLVPILVFGHSLPIGMTLQQTALRYIWFAMAAGFGLFVIMRIAGAFGWRRGHYRVSSTRSLSPDVTEIMLEYEKGRIIQPAMGQFVYINPGRHFGGSRPFTAMHFDPDNNRLGMAIKGLGERSENIRDIVPGEQVMVDGPYGVFLDAVVRTDRDIVMIAGGIGITPFVRLADYLHRHERRRGWLFYGHKTRVDIPYKEELESLENVTVIPVISDDPSYEGEKGYVTLELIERYLHGALESYEFLLCGPPAMIRKLETALKKEAGVPAKQIHHELFQL